MENERQEKAWEELTMKDNFMFCQVLSMYEEITKGILEISIGKKVEKILVVNKEQVLAPSKKNPKTVRLDVYVKGETEEYDIEMQVAPQDELPQRMRYYQSMMAANQLGKGDSYKKLNHTYVIFICDFDPFDKGEARYIFKHMCKCSDGELITLGDGETHIVLNLKYKKFHNNQKLKSFLDYMNNGIVSDTFTSHIAARLKSVKCNEEVEKEYMNLQDEYERREQIGIDKGINKEKQETAIRLIEMGLSTDQIVFATKLDAETVESLKKN